jgi:hypothetical protein
MTQDQHGQAPGTGYVVRGEVVPDDETEVSPDEQSTPMTHFQKVASALRGDRSEAPDDADAAPSEEVGAVRSPQTGDRDDWDNEDDTDGTRDPSGTEPATYGTTAATGADAGTGSAPYEALASQGSTAPGYGSQGGTAPGYDSQPGTTPGYGSQTRSGPGYGTEAGTATGYDSRDVTATDPSGQTGTEPAATGVGTGEPGVVGKHAAGAADAGLRPGEATDRLGDFGDIAFGNLLPDAERYTAQWQQIQFRFVDDPQGSVTEAADVISQVTTKLEAAIQERQRAIQERQRAIQERASALRGRWGEGSNADTETLRETLRMYRAFMDQLIGRAS